LSSNCNPNAQALGGHFVRIANGVGSFLAIALSAFSSPVASQPTNASAVFTAAARKANVKAE
jgi:hypothetical protein